MILIRLEREDLIWCIKTWSYFSYWDTDVSVMVYRIRYLDMDWYLMIRMTVEARFTMTAEIGYCYMQYRYMWYWSVQEEAVYWAISEFVIVFMLLKVIGKILSGRNTFIVPLFYRLHGNIVHIVIATSSILLLSPNRSSNRNNMDIDCYK